ncbi:MAG TPA: T9SS type A sorting domain-containing protein [Chryseosolibacter sp.]
MKKILILVFVALTIGQANAKGVDPKAPLGMSVIKSGNICKLFYRGEVAGDIEVTIYNENGRAVFSEVIRNKDNFMRPYNLSTLPEGNYTIALNDGQTTRVEKITHFNRKDVRAVRLIKVNNAEHKYLLAISNEGNDVLTITVFDQHNSLIYKGTEHVNGDFAKVYNLKGNGRFLFQVSDQKGRTSAVSTSPAKEN